MVADDQTVTVVTAQGTRHFRVVDEPVVTASGKWQVETTEGVLTVVKTGGCTCGKPWMKKDSPDELLSAARMSLGVAEPV